MLVRKVLESDMEAINKWWLRAGYQGMPFEALPKNTFIVFDDRTPVVFGSAYLTDTQLTYIDNFASNPLSTKEQRTVGIRLLISTLLSEAKKAGCKWWSAHSSLEAVGVWSKQFNETQRGSGHFWFTGVI